MLQITPADTIVFQKNNENELFGNVHILNISKRPVTYKVSRCCILCKDETQSKSMKTYVIFKILLRNPIIKKHKRNWNFKLFKYVNHRGSFGFLIHFILFHYEVIRCLSEHLIHIVQQQKKANNCVSKAIIFNFLLLIVSLLFKLYGHFWLCV